MTIGTTLASISDEGNGITTAFAYPFLIPNASEAVVIYTDTVGNQTYLSPSQYAITGIGNPAGGVVTYTLNGFPIAAGTFLTIQRILVFIQGTSLSNQGPTFTAIETALDYLTMLCQQLQNEYLRTIQLNVADQAPVPQLPPAAKRANQLLGFDGNGNPIVSQPSSAPVSPAMQPVVSASTLPAAWHALFPQMGYNFYVSPTGSDSNDGLTPATPFLTLGKAAAVAMTYFTGGGSITINLAHGTYTAGCAFIGAINASGNANIGGFAIILILGDVSSPGSVVLADASSEPGAIIAYGAVQVALSGFTITSVHGSACFPSYGANIAILSGMVFGACHLDHLHCETQGHVNVVNGYTITGGAPSHLACVLGGQVIYMEALMTVTLIGTPAFSTSFVYAEGSGSLIYANEGYITFSGACTGIRYIVTHEATIITESGGAGYFPGNAAGMRLVNASVLPMPNPLPSGATGLGAGGSAAVLPGSTDQVGTVVLTTGSSGTGATGSVTLTLGAGGGNNLIVTATLQGLSGAWVAGATVVVAAVSVIPTQASFVLSWSNAGSNLAPNVLYEINYMTQSI